MRYDWLIVGAGLSGATLAERIASQLDQRVLVIDKRDHIGGNTFDEYDDAGILVHRYGPHIFHTNSEAVWAYLSRFTEWWPYEHKVQAQVDGRLVPLPFNLNTIDALFPAAEARRLSAMLADAYGMDAKVPVLTLRESTDAGLRRLGEFVYSKVFESYTRKQWGLAPEELDGAVTGRVPVLVGRDDRYFQDRFQAQPRHGFTSMLRRMLRHSNIQVMLNADFRTVEGAVPFNRMVFTGPIDEFFGYVHGALPYRSLSFTFETLAQEQFQPVAVVNYPNDHAFTRITEFKALTGQLAANTSIVYECPGPYVPGANEPYYPIPREENRALYARYRDDAEKLRTVLFAGRLGDYSYYNMDQAVARGLSLFDKVIAP